MPMQEGTDIVSDSEPDHHWQRFHDLAAEIAADRHAARIRDYGEADAATYEQRVKDGAATARHLDQPPPDASTLTDYHKMLVDAASRAPQPNEREGPER